MTLRAVVFKIVLLVLLFSLSVPYAAHAAFGISPPFLNADHLVKGATYSQVIYLVQDQPNQNLNIHADLKIPDAARSWVTLDKGFDFVIPVGTRQFPVTVTITVPQNASLGVYSGNLSFMSAPAKSGQVTIALGVQAALNLSVGTGIYRSFSVPLVRFLDIEEGWNPRVDVKLQNDGNVSESIDGATVELYDQFNAARLAYIQKSSGLPEVPAFSTKDYVIEFPTDFHLGVGQYWGLVTLYQNQKPIKTEKAIFNVLKAGTLSGLTAMIIRNIENDWIWYAGALALISLFVAWRRRRLVQLKTKG